MLVTTHSIVCILYSYFYIIFICMCVFVHACVFVCVFVCQWVGGCVGACICPSVLVHDHSYLLYNVVDHFILCRVQCWAYELSGTVISILTIANANQNTVPVDWTTAMLQYPQDSISGAVTSSWACSHMSTCNRFANTWIDGNGTQHRQLTKAYGIRVNINVIGEVSLKILLNYFW